MTDNDIRTVYMIDEYSFIAPGQDDDARIAQRMSDLLRSITEPSEADLVTHHEAPAEFEKQNDDLQRLESDERYVNTKLLPNLRKILDAKERYDIVEVRTRYVPGGKDHTSPTIGFSRWEWGANRIRERGIPQDQLLSYLDTYLSEPHSFLVLRMGQLDRAVIHEGEAEEILGYAQRLAEKGVENAGERLKGIEKSIAAHEARKEALAAPAPTLGR
jgi:hypothetical protein